MFVPSFFEGGKCVIVDIIRLCRYIDILLDYDRCNLSYVLYCIGFIVSLYVCS